VIKNLYYLASFGLILGLSCYIVLTQKNKSDSITLYGNVEMRQVEVGFQASGKVMKLFFEEGDIVKTGSLLALLDPIAYDHLVEEAAAKVDALKVQCEHGEVVFHRREQLIKSGGVSQEEMDQSKSNLFELQARLRAAKASLAVALDHKGFTELYAPSDGTICTRIREIGAVVRAGDPVYSLTLTSPVWVRTYLQEPMLGEVRIGMRAEVLTDTAGIFPYQGRMGFISPVAEFTPKSVETEALRPDLVYRTHIYVDNREGILKQGMPATVKLKRICD
jgi:HlyD family secretion protein